MVMKSLSLNNLFRQKRDLNILLEESKAGQSFYIFLTGSAFLITIGLFLNSMVIIIGGVLVAPLLSPVFLLAMGVTISSRSVTTKALIAILKFSLVIIGVSFVTSFVLNIHEVTQQMILVSNPNLLFSLFVFIIGILTAYMWAKKNSALHLPAIAVTISLVPSLASLGMALSIFSRDIFIGGLTLFLINIVSISVASVVVFSFFGYPRLQKVIKDTTKKKEED